MRHAPLPQVFLEPLTQERVEGSALVEDGVSRSGADGRDEVGAGRAGEAEGAQGLRGVAVAPGRVGVGGVGVEVEEDGFEAVLAEGAG